MHTWHKPNNRPTSWRLYLYSVIAAEVSSLTKHCSRVVQWKPRITDSGVLFAAIDCANKSVCSGDENIQQQVELDGPTAVVINGNFNYDLDIQSTLLQIRESVNRQDRIILVAYNSYLRFLYRLANFLGFREGEQPQTFLTRTDLENIARVSGFEITRLRPSGYIPLPLAGIGGILNQLLPAVPLLRWLALTCVITLRPVMPSSQPPSLSVIIPARNERGNIENALKRMPQFNGAKIEIIFVEGHSNDGTWEEIQRVIGEYGDRFKLTAFKQTGVGKVDAVRLGASKAVHELIVILDADLTMPPELLVRFYDAYRTGLADFINGSRITYPMEGQAMKFLNRLGNIFFAKALSYVLGVRIGDSLCGTKLFTRVDYERMRRWRESFGDFDPFGDFELLFPASIFGLGIIDIPVRYRDRTYGSTNIRRFYHGMMLLKMTALGFIRIHLGKVN